VAGINTLGANRALGGEGRALIDDAGGVRIRQMTSHPSINHPTYFLQSSFLPDGRVLFTSYRTGTPQLFAAGYPDGPIEQLTTGAPIHPFSPAVHPAGKGIVFTRGGSFVELSLMHGAERIIVDAQDAQLGEPALSADGEWVAGAYKDRAGQGVLVSRFDGTRGRKIPFPRTVIHPQFHPLEPEWIEFSADPAPRMHRVRRDGTGLECLYEHGNDEFVVHETFLGRTGDIVFTVWPRALCRMDWTTRAITTIASYNSWHIAPNRDGTQVLCDTNHPDEGIQIIEVRTGARRLVCLSQSSNRGTQWKRSQYALAEDFAEAARRGAGDSGALSWMESSADTVYGPQWSHPHPSWSGDESKIAFASDRTGFPQVYVAEL
jgi:oligogalacturonide lyase